MLQRPDSGGSLLAGLLRLAVPAAFARLGIVAMAVTDLIVVGRIAPHQLVWQALGWILAGPLLTGGTSLLSGVQLLANRAIDRGLPEAAGEAWRRGLAMALAGGIVSCTLVWLAAGFFFSAIGLEASIAEPATQVARLLALSLPFQFAFAASASFLEAVQKPLPVAAARWMANGLNLYLNLIFVPESGAIGSAWATVLSRAALFILAAVFILDNKEIRPFLGYWPDGARMTWRRIVTIGWISSLVSFTEACAFAGLSIIAVRAGVLPAFAIATGGIVTLAWLIPAGFATAVTTLIYLHVGLHEWGRVLRVSWLAIGVTLVLTALGGAAIVRFAAPIADQFVLESGIAAMLAAVMGIVVLYVVADGVQGTADAVVRARGVNRYPAIVRVIAFALVAPAVAWWFAAHEHRGLAGMLQALLGASVLAAVLLLVRLVFVRRPV